MRRAQLVLLLIALLVATASGCSSDDSDRNDAAPRSTTTASVSTTSTTLPRPINGRVVVQGSATLDGEPLNAEFLGAVVVKDGLVTPCQATLPPVYDGQYAIPVMAASESIGCGTRRADILLWTFTSDKQFFATSATPWPTSGDSAQFDATFSRDTPNGPMKPRTEIAGEIFEANGQKVGPGARVEAFVGSTRCGIASTRRGGSFSGYVLAVVGPRSIPGCTAGAQLTFRVNGKPAVETSVNDPKVRGEGLDLTQR